MWEERQGEQGEQKIQSEEMSVQRENEDEENPVNQSKDQGVIDGRSAGQMQDQLQLMQIRQNSKQHQEQVPTSTILNSINKTVKKAKKQTRKQNQDRSNLTDFKAYSNNIVLDPDYRLMLRSKKTTQYKIQGITQGHQRISEQKQEQRQKQVQRQKINLMGSTIDLLKNEMAELKFIIKDMRDIIESQQKQIQRLNAAQLQCVEQITQNKSNKNQQKSARLKKPAALKFMPQQVLTGWNINKKSKHYFHFDIQGRRITYKKLPEEGKNTWSYLFFKNNVSQRKIFKLTLFIKKSSGENIGFGIAVDSRADQDFCWNAKDCFEYVGFSRGVFQGGKFKCNSGSGICQGMLMTLNINLKAGSIEWVSDRNLEAVVESNWLARTKAKLVPFLRFKDSGDCVQILGQP